MCLNGTLNKFSFRSNLVKQMFSQKFFSFFTLLVLSLSLGSELFAFHAEASFCGSEIRSYSQVDTVSSPVLQSCANTGCNSRQAPCADSCPSCCHGHPNHGSHFGFSSVMELSAPQSQVTYSNNSERHIPTQYLPLIFRPPIS